MSNSSKTRPQVAILEYQAKYQPDFDRLNREWLEKYFSVEPVDVAIMADPEGYIIKPGGCILFAALETDQGSEIVGTGALILRAPGLYELAKMAVTEKHQGLGIGRRLIEALVQKSRVLGAHTVELVSNRQLKPALALYESFGFHETPVDEAYLKTYARCDIKMVYPLAKNRP